MTKYSFIRIAVLFATGSFAQLDNSSLFFNQANDTSYERAAYIKVQNLNYLKNNEYYGPIADGYTLFGVQLNPQLGYQVSKNLCVEAGVFLEKDFGNKNFNFVLPTFSLRYAKKDFKMVFGNLDGSLNHQLIEPIYNFERIITNRLENGVQFMVNKRSFDFDVWVDWQNAIYKSGGGHEQIWAGISGSVLKLKKEKLEFRMPLQATALHSGGQIDTSNTPSFSHFTYSGGFAANYAVSSRLKLIADARYVRRVSYLFSPAESQTNGDGLLATVGFTAWETNFLFSYWYGHNFVSDFGGYLYSSQSSTVFYANTYEPERTILIMRITKKLKLAEHVVLTMRLEPYYDFRLKLLEYSYGFFINLDEKLWLKKK